MILIAHYLSPADTAQMNREKIIGFVTDIGGKTSHTAILARALKIPAVVGAERASLLVSRGDRIILDGREGLVIVNLAFDEDTGIVVYGPEIVSRGFVFETETGHLVDDAQCVILEIIEDVGPDVPDRVKVIRTRLQTALRQYFYFTIGRRPVILPFIMVI